MGADDAVDDGHESDGTAGGSAGVTRVHTTAVPGSTAVATARHGVATDALLRADSLSTGSDPIGRVVGGWPMLPISGHYLPKIGSQLQYAPDAPDPSKKFPGRVLAFSAPCGRAKSTIVYSWLEDLFRPFQPDSATVPPNVEMPPKVLVLTANIMYDSVLSAQLRGQSCFEAHVGYYLDKAPLVGAGLLPNKSIVLCSLQSLHLLKDVPKFDIVILDEIRTIASYVNGETMKSKAPSVILRRFCTSASHVIVSDADLLFTSNASEGNGAVHAFLHCLVDRPVVCAHLTDPGPAHLRREARLYYGTKAGAGGKWLGEED